MRKTLFVAAVTAALPFGPAVAQDMPKMAPDTAFAMPKACEPAAQAGGMAGMTDMPDMKHEGDGSKKEMSCMKDGQCAMMKGMDMKGGDAASMPGMGESQMASMRAMRGMMKTMRKTHGIKDPDLAFVCGMIAHHRGAVAMSKIELEHGKDEQAKDWAKKIIADQEKEIAEFEAWANALAK
ncbi:DUF305 domain-containing protein [Chelatococcus sambhunathii]|uniref:DUF305 domain-containing protein n=1 Tax=Chelatococcus sambhunathii TaxID=363953 RepID=A0ABU1DD93_9HYPH|nr:DUF305 domain-containing protein [Chelatococcus sambhunathii]MDR4306083.1 DUF305 domain-containing protein [Chelatococcus sambhunathii]